MAGARGNRGQRRLLALLVGLAAVLALTPAPARAQPPLFAFAQFSDVQANEPVEFQRFEDVLEAISEAGMTGALLPHPISAVFIAGDLVDDPQLQPEWLQLRADLDLWLTDNDIPFLAVPGNRDQDEFGTPLYETSIAPSGVWDVSSAQLLGQNGVLTATGWEGLRFVGVNNAWAGGNTVRPADLSHLGAIVSSSAASGENVFIVSHHPHDDEGAVPLANVLETPGVVGYLRGHKGSPQATQGLAGIANPVWDLSSESVMRDAALIYYEVHATEILAYVLELETNPTALPTPSVLTLANPLWSAAPAVPIASFAANPKNGRSPLEVAFADLSAGHPTGWLWDFGDGMTSPERHPIHVYTAVGSYDVSLVASNAQGSDGVLKLTAVGVGPPFPSLTLAPLADARVFSGDPGQNYGSSTTFRARLGSSTDHSYLRFAVSGLEDKKVKQAVLRLFVTDPSDEGGTVTVAAGGWDESTITWANAPGIGSIVLDSLGTVFPDAWVEFDVSALVTADGTYDFALSSTSSNSARYSSREGTNPPQLVVSTPFPVPALGPFATVLLGAALALAGARILSRRTPR